MEGVTADKVFKGVAAAVSRELRSCADTAQAAHLSRFFKTAPGEYGEGDRFLGIKVPVTRSIVRRYRDEATFEDVEALTGSAWHEERLAGFLLLVELYRRGDKAQAAGVYIGLLHRANNWDLVDLSAPYILGDWLARNPGRREILDRLADDGNLWRQRASIVSTLGLIRAGQTGDTVRIAVRLLGHGHDLIHKAVGWMLREVGKRDRDALMAFLDSYAPQMARTALRYAIEKLDGDTRRHYMELPRTSADRYLKRRR